MGGGLKGKPPWYSQIRWDVDAAITRPFLFDHSIDVLKRQRYEGKLGKYIAVRPPENERFVRLKSLGDSYTEESIRQRIRNQKVGAALYKATVPTQVKVYHEG